LKYFSNDPIIINSVSISGILAIALCSLSSFIQSKQ